jgi:hypothetical protein
VSFFGGNLTGWSLKGLSSMTLSMSMFGFPNEHSTKKNKKGELSEIFNERVMMYALLGTMAQYISSFLNTMCLQQDFKLLRYNGCQVKRIDIELYTIEIKLRDLTKDLGFYTVGIKRQDLRTAC